MKFFKLYGMQSYPKDGSGYNEGISANDLSITFAVQGGSNARCYAARSLQHRGEIAHKAQQHFARYGGSNLPARTTVILAIAGKADLAASANHKLIVAATIVIALRRTTAKLHRARCR